MKREQAKILLSRITSNPGIFNGKPIIRGMRFKVSDMLGYLASGMTQEEILNDFPYLEANDIIAALTYAAKKIRPSCIICKIKCSLSHLNFRLT